MYKDIWIEDPVSSEEISIKYRVDPSKDYFVEVDRMQPAWVPENTQVIQGSGAALSDRTGPREVVIGTVGRKKQIRTIPYVKYVRAIDPAGNLCCFSVSTCRQTPERPDGDDGLGTYMRIISEKSKIGWLVLERDPATWNPYSGKQGQDYIAWALAVSELRKRLHAMYQKSEAQAFMSRSQVAAEEQLQATKSMAKEIGKEVAEAVLGEKARRGGHAET